MTILGGVIVYLLVFWTILFAVLPWGNKAKEVPEAGMAGSAPANPRIKQKFLITLGVSTVIWLVIMTLIHLQIIDFYEISRQMVEEDGVR